MAPRCFSPGRKPATHCSSGTCAGQSRASDGTDRRDGGGRVTLRNLRLSVAGRARCTVALPGGPARNLSSVLEPTAEGGARHAAELAALLRELVSDVVGAGAEGPAFVQEHTRPLATFVLPPALPQLDALVRLEHASADWASFLGRGLGLERRNASGAAPVRASVFDVPRANEASGVRASALAALFPAELWPRWCALHAADFACLGYEPPAQCRGERREPPS